MNYALERMGSIVFRKGALLLLIASCVLLGVAVSFREDYAVLVAAIALIVILLMIYRTQWIQTMIVLLPFMFYADIGFNLNISVADFALPIVMLGLYMQGKGVLYRFLHHHKYYFFIILSLIAVIFFSVYLSSLNHAVRYLYGLSNVVKIATCFAYFSLILFYFYRYGKAFEKTFLKAWNFMTCLFSTITIAGVVFFYNGISTAITPDSFRARGTFEDPNLAAAFLILSIGICITYNYQRGKMFGLNLALVFVALFLTSSRGGVIGLLIGVAISMVVLMSSMSAKGMKFLLGAVKIIAIIVIVGAIVYSLDLQYVNTSVERITQVSENDAGTQNRLLLWETALRLWSDNPYFGVGSGQYVPFAQTVDPNIVNIPHNTYFGFLAETGLVGFLLLIAIPVLLSFRLCQRIKKGETISIFLFVSLVGLAVQAFTINIENFRVLWVFFAFVLYWVSKPETEQEAEQEGAHGRAVSNSG